MQRNADAPRLVARKVIKQIKNGEMPNVKRAALEVGYSSSTASKQTGRIVKTKAYQKEIKPFVDVLDELIADAVDIMKAKKNKASYRDATVGMKTMKDLKAIETGNPTEINKIIVDWDE